MANEQQKLCEEAEEVEDGVVMYPQVPEVRVLWTWRHWYSCGCVPAAGLAAL